MDLEVNFLINIAIIIDETKRQECQRLHSDNPLPSAELADLK
jgi:hypothetical protein